MKDNQPQKISVPQKFTRVGKILCCATLATLLSGCNAMTRISELGSTPSLAPIENPHEKLPPVQMPMPAALVAERQPNSLWQPGARAFFRDQRASRVGDILTVNININDKAELENESKRTRTNSEGAKLPKIMGYETALKDYLSNEIDPTNTTDIETDSSSNGKGQVDRSEKINLKVAATITQVLPNGNLVIYGKQQVAVNYDLRELQINGVIRPEDISSENTINYEQIAEARVAYGGRGQMMDVQQARYGQQLYDIIFPF